MKINKILNFGFDQFNDPEVGKLWAFNAYAGMEVNGAYASLPNWTPEEVIVAVADTGNDSWGPMRWHDNDVKPKYPASFDSENLLVIASTTRAGVFSSFTNIGPATVDVAAPGSSVYSTINGNKYGMASGTSMAAPNTSGVAAMVLGYFPELSPVELKEVLTSSVTKVDDFNGKISSGGRVNLKAALELAAQK